MSDPVRRIVTGHDTAGKSVFLAVESPAMRAPRGGIRQFEIWRTAATPAPIGPTEPETAADRPQQLGPGDAGSVIRIIDLEPGHMQYMIPRSDGRHPGMHRTETIDYGVMIEGELHAILDDAEILLRPGDVIVQRGTDHAWENRSDKTARIAFILLPAAFTPELRELIPDLHLHAGPIAGRPAAS